MTAKTAVAGDDFGDEVDVDEARIALLATDFPGINEVDPASVTARMAARMQGADSLDALFDALTGQASEQLIGRTFTFLGVTWQPYESDKGIIPLAVCEVADPKTGEVSEFVTTGTMLVHFLRRAQVIGAFPFTARIVGKRTRSGQTALNFERA